MANKYKVGDRVKLVGWKESTLGKKPLYGKVDTIKCVTNGERYPYNMTNDRRFAWRDEELEPAGENKIVITTDGKTTLARLYDGSKVIKSAEAKCSPEDTFDFAVGAKLAYERLMGEEKKEVKPTESLENVTWKVVKRPAKKGDYIRIIKPSFTFDRVGDILKVFEPTDNGAFVLEKDLPHGNSIESPDFEWCYCDYEYEVVEKVEAHTYKSGDKVKVIGNSCCHHMKVGDIITLTDNFGGKMWHYREHLGYVTEKDIEPYTPVVVNGFKVGDRVNYNGHNGTVICIDENDIGVEFDERWGTHLHDCNYGTLVDGKRGTKNSSWWVAPEDINHGELPKYYNGKVVCVKTGYPDNWTVGKVYEVKDGIVTSNWGRKLPTFGEPYRDSEDVRHAGCDHEALDTRHNSRNEFIPYVE